MSLRPAAVCLALLVAAPLHAQGTAADYRRADDLAARRRSALTGLEPACAWSADGARFAWLAPGAGEVREVDVAGGAQRVLAQVPGGARWIALAHDEARGWCALQDDGERARVARLEGDAEAPVEVQRDGPFTVAARREGVSTNGGAPTRLWIHNPTAEPLELAWARPDGTLAEYGRLAPGDWRAQRTYAGHVFVLREIGGDERARFTAERDPAVALAPEARPAAGARRRDPVPGDGARPGAELRVLPDAVRWRAPGGELREWPRPAELAATPLQGPATLAPDGAHALLHARTPGLGRRLTLVESAPEDRLQPRTLELDYDKPGDALATDWPILLDLATGVFHALDRDLLAEPDRLDHETWSPDGARLYFRYVARGHQCARWLCADAASGALRVVLEERSDTFLDDTQKGWVRYLPATDEVLWMSERSGFNHLYRFAANGDGALHAVTAGDWLVRSVESVDAAAGTLEFTALGVYPDQDPYHVHYGRVHLDGSGLTWLTEGDGTHELRYAPDRASFVDTYSRVDLPPVAELRRSADGARLAELGAADVAALVATGWRAPERFAAPGRDGVTPIWGVLHVPQDFDPERRYPVIEHVYAGPHGCFVPKRFAPFHGVEDLCELGFVVVQIDGMGTNWRSKAFHDVCWKDLADSGFPDRIAWMRAAAATRPWMDLARVGIYGGSAGGQSALRAVLDHPDVYRAAAADCGCHDNRMDKRWWNEAWLGYPVDASYLASSNVADAHRLGAPLLLTVGALDRNVDPSSTLQVVQALIDADKDFELVVFPRGGHGAGDSAYGVRRRRDFFVRHLLGVEPRR